MCPKGELQKHVEKKPKNHLLLRFSEALLALRLLRGDVLLSQLRDFK